MLDLTFMPMSKESDSLSLSHNSQLVWDAEQKHLLDHRVQLYIIKHYHNGWRLTWRQGNAIFTRCELVSALTYRLLWGINQAINKLTIRMTRHSELL